jgi:hypothetical protein
MESKNKTKNSPEMKFVLCPHPQPRLNLHYLKRQKGDIKDKRPARAHSSDVANGSACVPSPCGISMRFSTQKGNGIRDCFCIQHFALLL